MQIQDHYWSLTRPASTDPTWHDNWMHDNAYSVVNRDGTTNTNWFFDLLPTVGEYNNVDALGHPATTADEQAEYARWKQKLVDNGVTVGPMGYPSLAIADVTVVEGDSGTTPLTFTAAFLRRAPRSSPWTTGSTWVRPPPTSTSSAPAPRGC